MYTVLLHRSHQFIVTFNWLEENECFSGNCIKFMVFWKIYLELPINLEGCLSIKRITQFLLGLIDIIVLYMFDIFS